LVNRWTIGALLFASTVINYIDRQTLSVLAPILKDEYHWRNEDFALVVIAFRCTYTLGQAFGGRFLDRVGTRTGLSFSVAWYSLVAMLTSLASGLRGFCFFRFLLGAGESLNWPGATKTVAEWFPAHERSLAVALFDSGSAVGAAVAPMIVLWLYHGFGSWRPAFAIPGVLGLIWLVTWRRVYRQPPPVGDAPRLASRQPAPWRKLIAMRQTWGVVLGRSLTDPVWFFITDWFAIYLVSKGIQFEQGVLAFWIPFVAADAGNFLGGGASSWLVRRGWPAVRARKAIIVVGGIGMAMLAGCVFFSNLYVLAALFTVSTCAYAAWSTMCITLPTDIYPPASVATVSGWSGAAAGVGTIISTFLIGYVSDRASSFAPVLVTASIAPLVATALVLLLVNERTAVE
jgi:MFS transporter, ACS family, hexuronate transporter